MLIADINGANTYFAPYDPMRGLLAAILERAVRDLRDHEEKHRESARNWFNGVDVDGETHFTFSDVCHYLGLTHAQILFVLKLSSESTAQ